MTYGDILAILIVACGAPAPIYKPAPAPYILGKWVIIWKDNRGEVTFNADGTMRDHYGGDTYTGTWKITSDELEVHEKHHTGVRWMWKCKLPKAVATILPTTTDRVCLYRNSEDIPP